MPTSHLGEAIRHLRSAALRADGADLTDAQLLESFVSRRDSAALEGLVRRHGSMVWAVCRRILGHYHDAEDAFQATFLVLVRRAASITPRALVGNWLYGVAHQTASNARATRAKRRVREAQHVTMPEPTVTDGDPWSDLRPLLDQELSRLPDRYRAVLVLCDLEGRTRREAARQLGLPEGTVGSRLARGRALLAKRLARHGPAVSGAALAGVVSQAAMAAAPASVMSSTIKAVTLVAAGATVSGAAVSLKVAALAEGVLKAMYLNKLMKATAVLCVISMLVFAAGQLGYGTAPGTPGQATPRTATKSTRIVVPAALVNDGKVDFSIISVNPDTGSWKRLTGIGDYPRVSSDGQTVLFLRDDAVWNCDAAGSDNPGKLFAWSGYGGPVWSADGKHLYYSTVQNALGNNLWQHQSWRCDADGGNPLKLKLPVGEAILDVSHDSKYCVTRSRLVTRLNSSALMIMKLDGTGSQRLSAGGGFNEPARFAPDGKRVAYCRNDDAGFSVWTVAADGKHNRKVFGEAGVFVGSCCWSPDGRRLAVVAADLMPAQRPDGTSINIIPYLRDEGHWRIEIMDADGQNRIRLPLKAKVRSLGRADWHGLSD